MALGITYFLQRRKLKFHRGDAIEKSVSRGRVHLHLMWNLEKIKKTYSRITMISLYSFFILATWQHPMNPNFFYKKQVKGQQAGNESSRRRSSGSKYKWGINIKWYKLLRDIFRNTKLMNARVLEFDSL